MSKINVRSPYYISVGISPAVANLTSCKLELFIYTGTRGVGATNNSRPTTATYTLRSFAVENVSTFEISELVRDYFSNSFDGDYSSEIQWVDYRTTETHQNDIQPTSSFTQLEGFYGYGFFEDGLNPLNNKALLQSNTNIVKLDDAPATIAVDTALATQVTYELNGEQVFTKAISTSTNSNAQIEYVTSGVNGSDEFEDRVIQAGGTFEGSPCLEAFEG